MKFSKALADALGGVDQENWRGRLDALHDQHGSWKAVSAHLGVDKRTVERWRFGYTDKHGTRRQIGDKTVKGSVVPKVRAGWKADRKAQVQAVNWTDLSVVGTLQIGDYDESSPHPPRRENMSVGRYLSAESIADIAGAYVNGDDQAVDDAMDRALGTDYTGTNDAKLLGVEKLEF